ncbi:MAG: DegT/DnrJ/EryC1/StrS family aminotransferase [Spirulinaceae cyanobacterium SM2_1_0]|nr:DegT/DnrJ/EryC1/StrS family aminotransferase [Spirulinaceae cyanobacterium SM2_1_0]
MPVSVPFLDLVQSYGDGEKIAVTCATVAQSGWYILGPEVAAFEREFAAYCGAAHGVGVGNGLDALRLLLLASDIGPGAEVIVPANTYIATILAITQTGATPVLVEPALATLNLDPARVEAAISPHTRAMLAVHLYGNPAAMVELQAIASRHDLLLFDDCAQAHGATIGSQRLGSLSNGSGFSFFPTKNLGCLGDGGAVTTNDGKLAERLRCLRNYGSQRKYYNQLAGWNSRLDELQAAILRQRLPHLDQRNAERRRLAQVYIEALQELPLQLLPYNPQSVYHLLPVLCRDRDSLQAFLKERGIATMIHYPLPPHQQDCYRHCAWAQRSLPLTEAIAQQELSLPLYPGLTDAQQTYVIEQIRAFYFGP